MKLHDLRPAEGSRTERTRVGRGIAAGKGKTAGRGTKGQKARAGGSIPPWFEGGQTPLHQRIPKLRGFRNRFKVQFEVVNLGRISELVDAGRIQADETGGRAKKPAPLTVNQDILRSAGAIRSLTRPMKVLGSGDVTRPLFVVADAFTESARRKIEAAGGTAQLLEAPAAITDAVGIGEPATPPVKGTPARAGRGRAAAPVEDAPVEAAPASRPDASDEPQASPSAEAAEEVAAAGEAPAASSIDGDDAADTSSAAIEGDGESR
ncbi:MAG TPA: 50S ribosomal protein L15 [Candidatus Limnocylindrales bacterium]|nr:50S ribosomal protein L15 [Candidatus Limnocylindrales bacterium]